jgi:hypothetical protein
LFVSSVSNLASVSLTRLGHSPNLRNRQIHRQIRTQLGEGERRCPDREINEFWAKEHAGQGNASKLLSGIRTMAVSRNVRTNDIEEDSVFEPSTFELQIKIHIALHPFAH